MKINQLIFKAFLLCFFLFNFATTYAQDCTTGRFFDPVFSNVDVDLNVNYGNALQPTIFNPNATTDLDVNVYEPAGDTMTARPLIIWAFGGAFVTGTKVSPDIVTICNDFAQMGYVTASIDYRLSPDLIVDNSHLNAYEAVMLAMHDMKAAIRFFYKDAATNNTYKIDTNKIFIGGVSAGAIAAVHVAYLDDVNEVPAPIYPEFLANGGLEGNSGNSGYSSDVAGVINLCGAALDTLYMLPGDEPIVSMHGTNDGTVPYDTDLITLLGINLQVAGSESVHQRANNIGLTNAFYTWQGAGHVPFTSSTAYMDTTIQFVKEFLQPCVCTEPIELFVKAILEGPSLGNGTMRTDLVPFMPLQTPYAAAPYNAPVETATAIPANAVDWVLVEVRDGVASTSGPRTSQTIYQKSAFLLDDGSVVDLDGVSPLKFLASNGVGNYIALRNRNHLDVMSSTQLAPVNGVITHDFTTGVSKAFGNQQMKVINGFAMLHAGDITQDHVIQVTDYDAWKVSSAILNVYDINDTNHDGTVQTTDYDLWYLNKSKLGHSELDY